MLISGAVWQQLFLSAGPVCAVHQKSTTLMLAALCVAIAAAYSPIAPLRPTPTLRRCAPIAGVKGPPPIPSRRFSPLSSLDNFTATLKSARRNQITVVKFQAPWCRTCRAMAPKLDSIAKKFPTATYYSIESIRNGKAAGERMHKFFLSHNAVCRIALPSTCSE